MSSPHPTLPPPSEPADGGAVDEPSGEGFDVLIAAAQSVSSARLLVGRSYDLGRAPESDVVVNDVCVSRCHARLTIGAEIRVEDLGSSNGTKVNNRPLATGETATVGVGGVIELGSVVIIVRARHDGRARTRKRRSGTRPALRPAPPTLAPICVPGDARMQHLHSMIDLVAPTMVSVLVLGETGVGKEVFATKIHRLSKRVDMPFLKLNCAALAESLLESELFGHEKGAFTGAVTAKPGLLESAHGGTVFLDEIGEMPLLLQAKLLRFLETGEVLRIGSLTPRRVDVRIISATNRDLNEAMQAGTFRTDLYFRLNGIALTIPPLRERRAEIAPLARRFAELSAAKHGLPVPAFEPETIEVLESWPWVGNVRELRNVIDLALALWAGDPTTGLTPEHLTAGRAPHDSLRPTPLPSLALPPPPSDLSLATTLPSPPHRGRSSRSLASELRDLEKQRIEEALTATGWNQSKAARKLGVTRAVLMHRIKSFALVRPTEIDEPLAPAPARRRAKATS